MCMHKYVIACKQLPPLFQNKWTRFIYWTYADIYSDADGYGYVRIHNFITDYNKTYICHVLEYKYYDSDIQ